MVKNMKYFVLNLQGLLMSFGEGDYWDIRGTNNFPTKSFIVGLIVAGLGYQRIETEKIQDISKNISVSCREDKHPEFLRDYQTILNTKLADGKINKNAVISPRHYLADGAFTVLIGLKNEKIESLITDALTKPIYPPYFGRKCCIPSRPIFDNQIIYANSEFEAFCKIVPPFEYADDYVFSCIDETNKDGRMSFTKDDVISFEPRIYKDRKVYYYTISKKDIGV